MVTKCIGDNTGDDFPGTEDVELTQDPPTPHGSTANFYHSVFNSVDRRSTLIRFTGISSLPSSLTVTDAKVSLYQESDGGGSNTSAFRRVLRAWIENEAEWNLWKTGSSWTADGCLGDATDRVAAESGTGQATSNTDNVYHDVVTALEVDVENFADGTWVNDGWLFSFKIEDAYNTLDFFLYTSSEGVDGQRPTLTVTYTSSAPSGTAIQTLPSLNQAGTGIQTFSATAAQTLASLLQSGTGNQGTVGTATQTLAALIQTGNSLLVFTATASSMLAALIQSGVGVMLPSGTTAQTLASLLQDATGNQGVSATSIQMLPAVSQAGTGVMLPSGTSSLILASLLQSASGAIATQSTGAQTLASILQSGTGVMLPSGTSSLILASLLQAAVGESKLVGTGANILAAIQQAAIGIETFPGSGALTLPSIIQAGTGQLLIIATASQILPAITQVASEAPFSALAGGITANATYIISIDANALYGSIVAEPKTNLQ